eukprot:scaffold23728_cov129-Isochrysis_galbana.AAC.3
MDGEKFFLLTDGAPLRSTSHPTSLLPAAAGVRSPAPPAGEEGRGSGSEWKNNVGTSFKELILPPYHRATSVLQRSICTTTCPGSSIRLAGIARKRGAGVVFPTERQRDQSALSVDGDTIAQAGSNSPRVDLGAGGVARPTYSSSLEEEEDRPRATARLPAAAGSEQDHWTPWTLARSRKK